MRRLTNYQIIIRALEMLKVGILTSDLSARLIDEFNLTPERAQVLAGRRGDRTPQEDEPAGQHGYKVIQ